MKLILNVKGMKCEGCENRIKNVVSSIDGVREVSADYKTGVVTILCEKDLNDIIINAIEDIDFEVVK